MSSAMMESWIWFDVRLRLAELVSVARSPVTTMSSCGAGSVAAACEPAAEPCSALAAGSGFCDVCGAGAVS